MSLKRKSISLILSFILIILAICPNAYAQDIHSDETISVVNFSNKSIPKNRNIKILTPKELSNSSALNVDIVNIDSTKLIKQNVIDALELVDNGSYLIIQNSGNINSISELCKKFNIKVPDIEFDFSYKNCINIGYIIKCDYGEYDIFPIMATVMCEIGNESDFSLNEELKELRKSEVSVDIADLYKNIKNESFHLSSSYDNISNLQMSVKNVKSKYFKQVNGYGFFYAKSKNETQWGEKAGYTCYGLAEASIYIASEGKRSNGVVNDMVYCDFDATGKGNKHVLDFTTYIETSNSVIQDYLVMNSQSKYNVSYSYGWNGDAISSQTAINYTVNPNKCTISTQSGGNTKKSWVAKPNSYVKNQTWRFSPWVLVKTKDTKTTATINCGFSQFTVDDSLHPKYRTTAKLYCKLKFKNHKVVSWKILKKGLFY